MKIINRGRLVKVGLCYSPLFEMQNDYIKSNALFADKGFETVYQHIHRPIIVADQLRNPDNAGAMIRLADNIGAKEVFFLGDATLLKMSRLKRAAASSVGNIPWSFVSDVELLERLPSDYTLLGIETSANAENLFEAALPNQIVFFVGNEVKGIRAEWLERMHQCVYIPVPGPTRSLNVSHAAAVVMFEWLRQKMC